MSNRVYNPYAKNFKKPMQDDLTDVTEMIQDHNGNYIANKQKRLSEIGKYNATSTELSVNDEEMGRAFCKTVIEEIVAIKLPSTLKNKPELKQIVDLQSKFEIFTLQSMFKIISKAIGMLSNIDIDDIYDMTGMIDVGKWHAHITMQQNCMNLISQFSMHVRRLPVALSDMIRDIEYSQIIEIQSVNNEDTKNNSGTNITSTPLAQMLRDAENYSDFEEVVESKEHDEPLEDTLVPETEKDKIRKEIEETEDFGDVEIDMDL